MPVTGCTWQSSPNALGCWDRGEPPRPVRVGGESPPDSGAQGRRPDPFRRVVAANLGFSARGRPRLPCLVPSSVCVGPGGRGWRSVLVQLAHQWLGMPWMPHTQASRLGTSCACGDISVRPGTGDALGDGIAVPDGVECPRPEGHAPGRVECPRWWREPDGYGCSVWPGPDLGAQRVRIHLKARGLYLAQALRSPHV